MATISKDGLGQETLLFPVSKVAEVFSVSKKSVHRASIERFMSNTRDGGTI
jgi:hypothetical protein